MFGGDIKVESWLIIVCIYFVLFRVFVNMGNSVYFFIFLIVFLFYWKVNEC